MSYTPNGDRNFMAALKRVIQYAWFGEPPGGIIAPKPPMCLNAENLSAVNSTNTGEVDMIGVNSSNAVILPNGAALSAGKVLDVSLGSMIGGSTKRNLTPITADGAVAAHTAASYVVTKAGVAVLTLAAPTVGTDDGIVISIRSDTAFAHTLTATGLLGTGTASTDVATFAARLGSGLALMAFQGKWLVENSVGVTFS
jgi:hypothetical protein